jgi:hypothetical protein
MPCTHLFDELPTDMIYYEIFPYLDYNSRVTANLLLPLKDRLRTPLRKNSSLEFSMRLAASIVTSLVKKQAKATNNIARNRLSLKIWRTLPLFPQLIQHNARFRAVVSEKAIEFMDPALEDVPHLTPYTCKTLKALCEEFLLSLETSFPFLYEINSLGTSLDEWSAVTN